MDTLRIVVSHGPRAMTLIDEATGKEVLDWTRVEFAPFEPNDGHLYASVLVQTRDADGRLVYDKDQLPVTVRRWCAIRVGSVWSI